ncbi:Os05g0120050, partial [Oryza sativa Japonica Group]
HDIEQKPEKETKRHGDQQALPPADVRDSLLRQHVGAGHHARLRQAPRRVAELVLEHRLVRILDQRQVVEPDPVAGDAVAVDEEAGEEQEVGEDGDDHRVSQHDVRHHRGQERHEPAPRPERRQHGQREEGERRATAGEPDGEEGGHRERQRQHHQRRERDGGVGHHVGESPVRVVRRFPEVDVALLDEHRQRVGADVEHGGHGHGEEAETLLDSLGRVVEAPEDGGEDEPRHHDRAEPHHEQLRHAPRVGERPLHQHPHLHVPRVRVRRHRRR